MSNLNNLEFVKVEGQELIELLCGLADEIWREHFPAIIGEEQVDYMLEKFQSVPAVSSQIEDGYEYRLFRFDGEYVGYMGFRCEEDALFLSKIYIKKESRGNSIATAACEYLINICREKGIPQIYLTVNKFNTQTIHIYEKLGFEKIKPQVTDIGNGFVMNDYVMELTITD